MSEHKRAVDAYARSEGTDYERLQKEIMSEHSSDTPPVCECGHDKDTHCRELLDNTCYHKDAELQFDCDCTSYAPPAASTASDSGHDWFHFQDKSYRSCRICMVVERRDKSNKPCKGPVKLRSMELTPVPPAASTPDEAKCENAKCQCGHDEFTYDANGNFWYCDKCERPCFAPQPTADAEGRAQKVDEPADSTREMKDKAWDYLKHFNPAYVRDRAGACIVTADWMASFAAAETSALRQQLEAAEAKVERLTKALADAIRAPMGVLPDSAERLLTHDDLKAAEIRRESSLAALTAGAEAPE